MNGTPHKRIGFHILTALLGLLALGFADGLMAQACSTSAWTGGMTGTGIQAGDVPTDGHVVYEASCSLGITPDGGANYVQDDLPDDEQLFIARFYTFLGNFAPGDGVAVPIYEGHSTSGGLQFTVWVEGTADPDIFTFLIDDGAQTPGSVILDLGSPVPTNWTMVEVVWDVAGASVSLRVNGEPSDGAPGAIVTGVTGPAGIDFVRLGALGTDNAIGVVYHDAYSSRRTSRQTGSFINHVGFESPGDSNMSGSINVTDLSLTANFIFSGYHGPSDCNESGDVNVTDMSCVAAQIF